MGFDIDTDALEQANENIEEFDLDGVIDLVHMDIQESVLTSSMGPGNKGLNLPSPWSRVKVDTVVMNPPFGTKNKGVDMNFLQLATTVSIIAFPHFELKEGEEKLGWRSRRILNVPFSQSTSKTSP
ncbi:hypothetical protein HK102_001096 [Quaeritorhiza haematococci]|nr:hypothetical protein HK102_001096 [Quaeritorhiza haematococci]